MPLQNFKSVSITAGGNVMVEGILERELNQAGRVPYDPTVLIGWWIVQGDVVVHGSREADGDWNDSEQAGGLIPGEKASLYGVSIFRKALMEDPEKIFFTWSQEMEIGG